MYNGDFKLKEYREANGVSIEDFATRSGVSKTSIL